MNPRTTSQRAGCVLLGALLSLVAIGACAKKVEMSEAPAEAAVATQDSESMARAATAAPAAEGAGGSAAPAAAPKASPRKLIKTVELSIEVRKPEEVSTNLQALAEKLGGYVSGVGANRLYDGSMQVALTLRIPVERLEEARREVKKLAVKVVSEQLRTDDVTDQLVDLDARLRALRATEAELLALLAESRQKARKVEEIMEVYRELTEIRTQIEQVGAQVAGLDRQVAYSTLQIQISPVSSARPVTGDGWQPGDRVRDSFRTLIGFLRGLGNFLIFAVIVGIPVLGVLWLALFLLRKLWRLVRGPKPPRAAPPGSAPPPASEAGR